MEGIPVSADQGLSSLGGGAERGGKDSERPKPRRQYGRTIGAWISFRLSHPYPASHSHDELLDRARHVCVPGDRRVDRVDYRREKCTTDLDWAKTVRNLSAFD